MDQRRRLAGLAATIGGVLLVVGSFLPWKTGSIPSFGSITHSGLDCSCDGAVSVAGGLILAALGVVFMRERNTWFLALLSRPFVWMPVAAMSLVAAAAVAVLWLDVNESVRSLAEEGIGTGAVGVGVYAMGAGAVASFAAALLMRSVEPRRIGGRLAWRSTVAS